MIRSAHPTRRRLRTMEGGTTHMLLLGDCRFDPVDLSLRNGAGQPLPLRTQSKRVLAELARAQGHVVARDALIRAVWQGIAVTDDSLVQCIKDIRIALSDEGHRIVRTVVGQGYALSARPADGAAPRLPVILIEPFRASGGPDAADLADAAAEELLIRLTPRVGMTVLTDPDRRAEAAYVIRGRASVRAGVGRLFVEIARAGGAEVKALADTAAGAEIADLPLRAADRVAALLRLHMIMHDGKPYVTLDDAGLTAQQLMAKAAWHMVRFRRENWRAAQAALETAVSLAPDNPVALAMLASMDTQMIPLIPFSELPADAGRAMALAQRAVELGHSIDVVIRTRANLRLWRFGDHAGARLDCRRALDINPVFHLSHLTLATSELMCGEGAAAAERLRRMMQSVPGDPQAPLYHSLLALAELIDGRETQAVEAAREGHDLNPLGSWNALVYAVAAADRIALTASGDFRGMVHGIDLPASHFLDMPFRDPGLARALAVRAVAAGVADRDVE